MGTVVDLDAVAAWMDSAGLGQGPLEDVSRLSGGTQNVMLRFRRGREWFVLRRGPEHLRSHTNAALRREMRVLKALSGTEVPHPRLIAGCPDESVLGGAVFYLMEPVEGFNASVCLPELHATDEAVRFQMGLAAVDALAALAAVDHVAVGLGDVGRPEGFLERQVPQWLRTLESYAGFSGYPGASIPAVDAVAGWLEENRPAQSAPGMLHGDYHLANLMYALDGPEVAAIVDWEMCTIADPLLDLGWLLATWPSSEDSLVAGAIGAAGGLPSPAQLIERYAARSTRDLSAVPWYRVLACFKLGIVLEGTYARALAGKAPMEIGERLHATTLSLFAQAQGLIRTG